MATAAFVADPLQDEQPPVFGAGATTVLFGTSEGAAGVVLAAVCDVLEIGAIGIGFALGIGI